MKITALPIALSILGIVAMVFAFVRLKLNGNAFTVSSMQTMMVCGAIIVAGSAVAFAVAWRRTGT